MNHSFTDSQRGAEHRRLDVVAVGLTGDVAEAVAARERDALDAHRPTTADDERVDDGDLISVERPVEALDRRRQILRQGRHPRRRADERRRR
jgi:hypothetical protein